MSAYLQGNYAPVKQESTFDNLEVIGRIPDGLAGMFVRNGPNQKWLPRIKHHRFDGDGMLHAVQIQDGKASYRNRYIRTNGFLLEEKENEAIWNGFSEPPTAHQAAGHTIYKNTSNTDLIFHGGRLLSLWEGDLPYAIDPRNLETLGIHNFHGGWESAFIAHPKVDSRTGEMMFMSAKFGPQPSLNYGVVGKDGRISHSAGLEPQHHVLMHDMAITENHSIVFSCPYIFDLTRPAKGGFPFEFDDSLPLRFGVIPRHGSKVRWIEAAPAWIWHTLNAYEEGDEIVLHAPRLERTNAVSRRRPFGFNPGEQGGGDWAGRLHEWRLNLSTGEVRETPLSDFFVDFPIVNPARTGHSHRYGFAVRLADQFGSDPAAFDAIVKFDLQSRSETIVPFGPERFGHECAWIPRGPGEYEGWLTTFVHDEFEGRSEMVIYDAGTPEDGPVARILIPARVPYGFHGVWVSAAQMQSGT